MQVNNFDEFVNNFIRSSVEGKIDMYLDAEGLSQEQYKELLRHFPLNELHRLEAAMG